MIEVNKTYEFLPGIDKQGYVKITRKLREAMLRVPGLVELYSQRNILGSPSVRLTLMWKTLADWAKFAESAERWTLEADLTKYATNIKIEIWEPSPTAPNLPTPTNRLHEVEEGKTRPLEQLTRKSNPKTKN